jgi:predicted nicotinamide N-methyase
MSIKELSALDVELRRRFRTRETAVAVGGRLVRLLHPDNAEDLIDESEFERDERLPYWADLWPSARVLAERVLRCNRGQRLLELGCGIGLVSSCAVLAELDVVASDYYEDALRFTRVNVWRNTGIEVCARLVDWRDPAAGDDDRFDFVVASDVLYERPYALHVARAFKRFLAQGGTGLLADPGRLAVGEFLTEAAAQGLRVETPLRLPFAEGAIKQTICLYEIRHDG